jgi:hypothetical protein
MPPGPSRRYLKICVPGSSERWPKTAAILEFLLGYLLDDARF